jgi:uncharacterized protein (TIGR03437 family)
MCFRRLAVFFSVIFTPVLLAQTAVLTCSNSAVPPAVRAEGIAERTGDILMSCSGGQPGAQVSGNMIVSLNVNVTNRILADGTLDALLRINDGLSTTTMNASQYTNNAVAFNGVVFNISQEGTAEFRIVNLRGNASHLLAAATNPVITASISFTGAGIAVPSSHFLVAVPQRALLASSTGRLRCGPQGSPLPSNLTLTNMVDFGTLFTSTRVTEGFASAFAPPTDPASFLANSGVRIIARYSGFPADARLFVPDAIAGSNADIPTSTGEFGTPAAGGRYTAGSRQLLLVRVHGADATGAGGAPLFVPPASGTLNFNSVSELAITGGSAHAVYEVVDADPFARETAQFPTFLGLPPNPSRSVETNFGIHLGPVSTVFTQSPTAWIPRFIETTPPPDCTLLGDCSANYFPQFQVDPTPLTISVGTGQQATRYIPVRNVGAGVLRWNATVAYPAGTPANWIRLDTSSGVNNGTIRVDVTPTGLQPGVYAATITIDGGVFAGTRSIPVTLTVGQGGGQNQLPVPLVQSVSNAANGEDRHLVAGSLGTIMGNRLHGQAVLVTLDGTPATLLYSGETQINFLVPAALAGKPSAALVVTVDGIASSASTIALATAAPAIFPGAVLNQNYSVNSETNPAAAGSIVQIFATGLPSSGVITAKVHDVTIQAPYYAGPAPGLNGVQQVNVMVPAHLPAMQTWVYVCGGDAADRQVCSPPQQIWLTR